MRSRRAQKKFVFGVVLSVTAILILMSSLNMLPPFALTVSISMIVGLYGVYSLFTSNFYVGLYAIFFATKLSQDVIINYVDVTKVGYWTLFFIATLLATGLELIFGSFKKRHSRKFTINFDDDINSKRHYKDVSSDSIQFDSSNFTDYTYTDESTVNISTSFTDTTRYIYSTNLERANLSSTLGSLKVFFQERELKNDVTLNLSCRLGHLAIYLPKEWKVKENLDVTLGDVSTQSRTFKDSRTNSEYTVYLNGSVSLGEIEIHYI